MPAVGQHTRDLMKFEIPQIPNDLASALHAAESSIPQELRPLIVEAARRLADCQRFTFDVLRELEGVASLRVGQMDSQSRHDDIRNQTQAAIAVVLDRARALHDAGTFAFEPAKSNATGEVI